MARDVPTYEFFLGGRDLEMETIHKLLDDHGAKLHDKRLAWGAQASRYAAEIRDAMDRNCTPVLIELEDDLNLADRAAAGTVVLVDHHGQRAGEHAPTSLEQVFKLLDLPTDAWSREFALVAANDRNYIEGMLALDPPASPEELQATRAADRSAQGVTAGEEAQGRAAVDNRELHAAGRLTVVRLPHRRTATVTDALHKALGGAGFESLLILCPKQTVFLGCGRVIEPLRQRYPGGWCGGALPTRGFWAIAKSLNPQELIAEIERII